MQNHDLSISNISWFLNHTTFPNDSVQILPTLLISQNLPFKLLFSQNKTLKVEQYPSLSLITKIFRSNSNKSTSTPFAIGRSDSTQNTELSENQFFLEIQFSAFSIIQAYRDPQQEKIFHKLEYRSTHYNSFVTLIRNHETIINDGISIEKSLCELTCNYAEAFERTGKSVFLLVLQFFIDREENLVFEQPAEWYLTDFIEEKGVRSIPIIFASFQYPEKTEHVRTYSIGLKPRPIQAKPRVQFKEQKYRKMKMSLSLKSFSQHLNRSLAYCGGDYCDTQIKNCQKSKKIPLYLYRILPHRTIRATVLSLNYPSADPEFSSQFTKLYTFNLKSTPPPPPVPFPISFKQTNLTLCPVCTKIITLVKSVHF